MFIDSTRDWHMDQPNSKQVKFLFFKISGWKQQLTTLNSCSPYLSLSLPSASSASSSYYGHRLLMSLLLLPLVHIVISLYSSASSSPPFPAALLLPTSFLSLWSIQHQTNIILWYHSSVWSIKGSLFSLWSSHSN